MGKQNHKRKGEDALVKSKEQNKDKGRSSEKEEEVERTGIIPENMDFKKFLGCGG